MLCAWVTCAAVAAPAGPALRRMELFRNLQISNGVAAGAGARQHPPGGPQLQAGDRCGDGSARLPAPYRNRTPVTARVSPVHACTLYHVSDLRSAGRWLRVIITATSVYTCQPLMHSHRTRCMGAWLCRLPTTVGACRHSCLESKCCWRRRCLAGARTGMQGWRGAARNGRSCAHARARLSTRLRWRQLAALPQVRLLDNCGARRLVTGMPTLYHANMSSCIGQRGTLFFPQWVPVQQYPVLRVSHPGYVFERWLPSPSFRCCGAVAFQPHCPSAEEDFTARPLQRTARRQLRFHHQRAGHGRRLRDNTQTRMGGAETQALTNPGAGTHMGGAVRAPSLLLLWLACHCMLYDPSHGSAWRPPSGQTTVPHAVLCALPALVAVLWQQWASPGGQIPARKLQAQQHRPAGLTPPCSAYVTALRAAGKSVAGWGGRAARRTTGPRTSSRRSKPRCSRCRPPRVSEFRAQTSPPGQGLERTVLPAPSRIAVKSAVQASEQSWLW